jgi:hypothetical protein
MKRCGTCRFYHPERLGLCAVWGVCVSEDKVCHKYKSKRRIGKSIDEIMGKQNQSIGKIMREEAR